MSPPKHKQAHYHTQTGQTKTVVPAVKLSNESTGKRGEKSTQVNAHVKDRKSAVSTCISFFVELPHHRGYVGFKKAVTHDQESESPKEVKLRDRKSTRLNSSHVRISYDVFCLKNNTV